jgi:hypothetical protein
MKLCKTPGFVNIVILAAGMAVIGCGEKSPSRDEMPVIKAFFGNLESAIRDKNEAGIDSLMIPKAFELGYSAEKILSDVYLGSDTVEFYALGRKNYSYNKDIAIADCYIMQNPDDSGRAVELMLEKSGDNWYLKKFDLK